MTEFWDAYWQGSRNTQDFLDDYYDRQAGRRFANALAGRSAKHLEDAQRYAIGHGRFDTGEWIRTRGGRQALGWPQPSAPVVTPPAAPPSAPAAGVPPTAAQGVAPPPQPAAAPVAPAAQVPAAAVIPPQAALPPQVEQEITQLLAIVNDPNAPPEAKQRARVRLNELKALTGAVGEVGKAGDNDMSAMRLPPPAPPPPPRFDAARGTQMLEDNVQRLIAADDAIDRGPNSPPGPITPAPGSAGVPAAGGAADEPEIDVQTIDLDQLITQTAPPQLSQFMTQLGNMRQNAIRYGLTDEVEQISSLMDNERQTAVALFGARLNQLLSVVPVLRGIDPNQRAAVAEHFIRNSPYGYDTDGSPLTNNDALQLLRTYAENGISNEELDQFEQTSMTLAERMEAQYRLGGSQRPLNNTERRVLANEYRTRSRDVIGDLGILRPSLPYARLALSYNGDTTQVPGVNFRQSDFALLRAAARAQTGPGVLTENEVWSTLSSSLQQDLLSARAYVDITQSGLTPQDRAALARFVTQSAANIQRDAWDLYESYEAQWGADVLQRNGMEPPRIPHPDDEPLLQAQESQTPSRGSKWSANGRTYRYDGPGNWTLMRSADAGGATPITASPRDENNMVTNEQRDQMGAMIRSMRRNPRQFVSEMRRLYNTRRDKDTFRAALADAVAQGQLTQSEYDSIVLDSGERQSLRGRTTIPRMRGGPQL